MRRSRAPRKPDPHTVTWGNRKEARRRLEIAATEMLVSGPFLQLLPAERWPGVAAEVEAMQQRLREIASAL